MAGLHTARSWKKIILAVVALGLLLGLQLTGMQGASAAGASQASASSVRGAICLTNASNNCVRMQTPG
jgi:hypothetical protein